MKLLLLASLAVHAVAIAAPGFFRYPAIHGETIVFTAEGDLWKVGAAGGAAQRLTSHPGAEERASISPDGKWIAFSAQYEGPTETYVMPSEGGLPKRLTWEGENAWAAGWTRDGRVMVATRAYSTLPNEQLITLDPATGALARIPLAQAAEAAWDDAGTLFFTRLAWQGSSTKRYTGGTQQQLWAWAPQWPEAKPLTTDYKGISKNPMWHDGRVWFLSDRSGIVNLHSMRPDGSALAQHTQHATWDAKSASLHAGRIVYQHGADLRLYDIAAKTDLVVPVTLVSDFDQTRERWVKKPLDYLTSSAISPDGDRIVLTARGQLFVAPTAERGRFIAVPKKNGVRLRHGAFFPDGKNLLAVSDESGELEFARIPANGIGEGTALTQGGTGFRFAPVVAPDGKWFAWQDKNQDLWVRDIEKKADVKVATSVMDEFEGIAWSHDSQWLAYVQAGENTYRQIKLFRPGDGARIVATSDRVNSEAPAWSADGRWLFFASDRALRSLVGSPWGDRAPEPHFTEGTKLYALALRKDTRPPWLHADELNPAAKDEPKPGPANIDDGLAERLWELPISAGNHTHLAAADKHLLWTEKPTGFDAKPRLRRWEIKPGAKAVTLQEDFKSWQLSANRKKLLLHTGDAFYVVDANAETLKLDKAVDLGAWTLSLDPREEWRQIYAEAWRMLRDYFYDPKLHGLDWPAIRRKYEPLLDRVADRADLNDILHEMSGELEALHVFVRYGDTREGQDQIKPGHLGARFERDPAGWRIAHIYTSDPDYPAARSPLAKAGIATGDIITAINGQPAAAAPHPNALLRAQAGRQVLLDVKTGAATRQAIVEPIAQDAAVDIRYDEWEHTRRLAVEQLGGGKIGYVHLRAMGTENIIEWARGFYPVFNRPGLIVDVRHNRGGNIDSWVLSRLLRKAWMYWSDHAGIPTWNMQYAFRGHAAVICNERTASDGEAFSDGFRRLGIGKVFGTRTWGGEIWLSANRWLVDSGMCSAPEAGVYGPEGAWLIEQHGVDPDVVVDNLPRATFDGKDAQLEATVKHLLEQIEKDPRPVPPPPAKPVKRR